MTYISGTVGSNARGTRGRAAMSGPVYSRALMDVCVQPAFLDGTDGERRDILAAAGFANLLTRKLVEAARTAARERAEGERVRREARNARGV